MRKLIHKEMGETIWEDFTVDQTKYEQWNEYFLPDGMVVRVKTVVTQILRSLTKTTPDGQPLIMVQTQNIITVAPPSDSKTDILS